MGIEEDTFGKHLGAFYALKSALSACHLNPETPMQRLASQRVHGDQFLAGSRARASPARCVGAESTRRHRIESLGVAFHRSGKARDCGTGLLMRSESLLR